MLEERILKLENEMLELRKEMEILRHLLEKKQSKKTVSVDKKTILNIITKSIKLGKLSEDINCVYIDKKIMHGIAKEFKIEKRALNYNILNNICCIVGTNKNNVYFQKRVNGKNIWLYRINKELFTNEIKELSENE